MASSAEVATTLDVAVIRGPLPERRTNARPTAALLNNPGCIRRAVLNMAQVDTARLADVVG